MPSCYSFTQPRGSCEEALALHLSAVHFVRVEKREAAGRRYEGGRQRLDVWAGFSCAGKINTSLREKCI